MLRGEECIVSKKRNFIDWDSIEPLYKLGILSNYDICRQYAEDHKHSQVWKINATEGAIRHRAKLKGWHKNIADKVQKQIKENLLRKDLRSAKLLSDEEIIDDAADAGASIVVLHRA